VVRVQGRERTGKALRSFEQDSQRRQQPKKGWKKWYNTNTPPRWLCGSICESSPSSSTSSAGSENSAVLPTPELRRKVKKLKSKLNESTNEREKQPLAAVHHGPRKLRRWIPWPGSRAQPEPQDRSPTGAGITESTGLQPEDLLPETYQPVSPTSTAPTEGGPPGEGTSGDAATLDNKSSAAVAQEQGSDSKERAAEPKRRASRASTRTAPTPIRFDPCTSSTAKTPRRAATTQAAKSKRKSSGARHGKGPTPKAGDGVADIVDTTGGGAADDN